MKKIERMAIGYSLSTIHYIIPTAVKLEKKREKEFILFQFKETYSYPNEPTSILYITPHVLSTRSLAMPFFQNHSNNRNPIMRDNFI